MYIWEKNKKNLDYNMRLEGDLAQSVNELWKILEKDENLHKWQHVVPPQSYKTVLQQKNSSENRNQVEEKKQRRRKSGGAKF